MTKKVLEKLEEYIEVKKNTLIIIECKETRKNKRND